MSTVNRPYRSIYYEYITLEHGPYNKDGDLEHEDEISEHVLLAQGFQRIWADINDVYHFIVYRRLINEEFKR